MFTILLIMFAGIALGWLLRKQNVKAVEKGLMPVILVLLFFLGINIGTNERIFQSLGTIGIEALVLGTVTTLGSVLAAWGLNRYIKGKEEK